MRAQKRDPVLQAPDPGSEWVARIHSGQMTDADRRAMRAWLADSTKNNREFLRSETVWRLCAILAADPSIQAELALLRRKPEPSTLRSPRRLGAIAAAVIAIVVGAALFAVTLSTDWHDTARGERRVVSLPDGSTVEINTDSRVGIRYTDGERRIALDWGEALFSVAPDPLRPFTVEAEKGQIRAVGTRFNVLVQNDTVTVAVLEGRVDIAVQGRTPTAPTLLDAGQSMSYGRSGTLQPADPTLASPQRIAAWREGKLHFDDWPLERALREYNRYSHKPIRLAAPDRAEQRIRGVFRIGDLRAFADALETAIDVKAVDQGDAILLVPPESARDALEPHAATPQLAPRR